MQNEDPERRNGFAGSSITKVPELHEKRVCEYDMRDGEDVKRVCGPRYALATIKYLLLCMDSNV